MKMISALECDWEYLSLAVEELEGYLLSPERNWTITGMVNREPADRSRLTIGGIRLCQARLDAAGLPSDKQTELTRLGFEVERAKVRWQIHWEHRAAVENDERIRIWQNALHDLKEESWSGAIFAAQVRQRAMIELLIGELSPGNQSRLSISPSDSELRWMTQPGPFVWETEIQNGFPEDKWWFLYRTGRGGRLQGE